MKISVLLYMRSCELEGHFLQLEMGFFNVCDQVDLFQRITLKEKLKVRRKA